MTTEHEANISSNGWTIHPEVLELKRLLRLALDLKRFQRKAVALELGLDSATLSRWLSEDDHREIHPSILVAICRLTGDYSPIAELCRQAGGTFSIPTKKAPGATGA